MDGGCFSLHVGVFWRFSELHGSGASVFNRLLFYPSVPSSKIAILVHIRNHKPCQSQAQHPYSSVKVSLYSDP